MGEICFGLINGLTLEQVFLYTNPIFNDYQMEQIRLGLEEGLDVSSYINPDFDWIEMEKIRESLLHQTAI